LEKRGIPTEGLRPKKLEEITLKVLDYVFTLCEEEEYPNIPNVEKKFLVTPDPAKASGTPEEVEKNI
jgi:protein-tyrosine-phosphatase